MDKKSLFVSDSEDDFSDARSDGAAPSSVPASFVRVEPVENMASAPTTDMGAVAADAAASSRGIVQGSWQDNGDDDDDDDVYFGKDAFADALEEVGGSAGAGAGSDGDDDEAAAALSSAVGSGGMGAGTGSDGFLPDLTLADGRVLSRRPRPEEGGDLEDKHRDAEAAAALKDEGNRHFRAAAHDMASACYTEALRQLPLGPAHADLRAICHANRAACASAAGRPEDALYDCDRALEANPRYVKALARRAAALEELGKLDEAAVDAGAWAAIEPASTQANATVTRLRAAAAARDEKLKEEMLGKLKEMGNWVLGKFGMSLDNFKAVQDPATGSYSIAFNK